MFYHKYISTYFSVTFSVVIRNLNETKNELMDFLGKRENSDGTDSTQNLGNAYQQKFEENPCQTPFFSGFLVLKYLISVT